MNIEKLEAVARAAAQGRHESRYTHPRDHNLWKENEAFTVEFDAPTALALLAVVRAAKEFDSIMQTQGLKWALPKLEEARAALRALEETK